jgi:hypothetical protein
MTVAKRLSTSSGWVLLASVVVYGIAVAVIYWQDLSRLWLVAAAIAINAISLVVRVYEPFSAIDQTIARLFGKNPIQR